MITQLLFLASLTDFCYVGPLRIRQFRTRCVVSFICRCDRLIERDDTFPELQETPFMQYCIVDFMAKVCDECGMQFNDNAELGVHMRQNHQKFYCGVCRKEFDNEVELKNHVKNIHGLA